ncbi:type II CRISPR RNA-guided endonuclease Cas9 [Segnochrobactrum spirostomi]|uniref:type II CRISPR RNA-guided endonuclease Cas9 n=1 Tax=Segnochrobactrum spirostomi TaxID=2608987 RepID=UPI001AD83FE2|nr:type II CRISPR RNA-guided endonuclease Cas9 [Segnochrobactrum spirostomi]
MPRAARTLGEFLHWRRQTAPDPARPEKHAPVASVRTRLRPATADGGRGAEYEFYPSRDLIEDEFQHLFEAQAAYHPELMTEAVREKLHEIVFFQRPLRAPPVGRCTLEPSEERLPKAHPLFQRRRLFEDVNALRVIAPDGFVRPLDRAERDLAVLKLQDKRKVSFESLRKSLWLAPGTRFRQESQSRTDIAGDVIRAQFADKKRFGPRWTTLSPDTQWAIIARLRDEEDEETLIAWLVDAWALTVDQAKAVARIELPVGFGRFGPTATTALIEELEADVVVYSEAAARAGYHHSDFRSDDGAVRGDGEPPALPYYGVPLARHIMPGTGDPADAEDVRIGRVTNPTVHIALNQIRRVINRLIRSFGLPKDIAVELARDLKFTEERKREINAENDRNRRAAERRSEKLRELGQPDTGANRAMLKLWEELGGGDVIDRRCVYSGRQISASMLFDGSVEVDHILPFSATLDDSKDNLVLVLREANRLKRKRSPYEARHDLEAHFGPDASWDAIAARAAKLPPGKRRRFEPDALETFEAEGGFAARQLVDTQYISRLAAEYLGTLYPERGEGSNHVWVLPGRLTELIRRKLGLNGLLPDDNIGGGALQEKNRLDHRHHAIDAFVIGITDRAMLNRIARDSGRDGAEGRERVIVSDPWPGFREDLSSALARTIASHRPDHGTTSKAGLPNGRDQTAGRLHNDTAYGLTGRVRDNGVPIVVHRIPITSIEPSHLGDDPDRGVCDPDLREALRAFTLETDPKAFPERLRRFGELGPLQFHGIRRVRIVEPLKVIPIRDREGRPYKAYKGDSNDRYDVWEGPDGRWQAEAVSMFEAHQPGRVSPVRAACPTARKVLSLHRDDIVALEIDGERRLYRVVKFSDKQITLAPPNEGGRLKARDGDPNDPFRYLYVSASSLKASKARQVRVDELGRVLDPGFPARKTKRRTRR